MSAHLAHAYLLMTNKELRWRSATFSDTSVPCGNPEIGQKLAETRFLGATRGVSQIFARRQL